MLVGKSVATLGLILETFAGLSYAEALHLSLVQPLFLSGTTALTPLDTSRGVIVGNDTSPGWNLVLNGPGIGMCEIFSTANDLTRIGRPIFAFSQLPPNTTRAWLRSTSVTSSLIGTVGLL